MTAQRRRVRMTEKELANELHARRNDPGEWHKTPVQAEISPQRAVVTSVRLPMAEFIAIQNAARASGQTVSEFIRNAIGTRLHQGVLINSLQIASGTSEGSSQATFLTPALEAGRTQNRIPQYANVTRSER
jgi:hypothetical protein